MPSETSFQIFVNERPLSVESGRTLHEVVRDSDADLSAALEAGMAYATDGVGREIDVSIPVAQGGIYRVLVSARRSNAPQNNA